MKTEYKYDQYCTPLSQLDCIYFFILAINSNIQGIKYMLVIVIDLIDEYFLKTNILYIGMKLGFSFFCGRISRIIDFSSFFSGIKFLKLYLEEYFAGIYFRKFERHLWKFIPTKITPIAVTFTPHVRQEGIAFWWTQGFMDMDGKCSYELL